MLKKFEIHTNCRAQQQWLWMGIAGKRATHAAPQCPAVAIVTLYYNNKKQLRQLSVKKSAKRKRAKTLRFCLAWAPNNYFSPFFVLTIA